MTDEPTGRPAEPTQDPGDHAREDSRSRTDPVADPARGAEPSAADDPDEGGARAARRRPPTLLHRLSEYAVVAVIAIVLAFLVKTFLVQPFWIPSESMEDTLITGDRIVVNKLPGSSDGLQRGDVVVFEDPDHWLGETPEQGGVGGTVKKGLQFVGLYPAGDQHLVKRIIGLPGDRIVCCDQQGRLTVNGVSITEPYVRAGQKPSNERFEITVPPGRLWLMGDNRAFSFDSRGHDQGSGGRLGSVPESAVTGKAVAVVWPLGRLGGVTSHHDVFAKVPAP
ncbi:signal peptidase I [Luteipulveratus sp. YIM 133132]|uniref:signal peptidase I n=1 Tax=Luteipulveratus flavus TaxID=3031728 RepID=UPI0023B0EBA5|nr:signal peptidase I [Luteipulveratus sp. YIM 133132]MDE9367896.1 signal peptidase I [Luteipulveratus sp. YIM 133132]